MNKKNNSIDSIHIKKKNKFKTNNLKELIQNKMNIENKIKNSEQKLKNENNIDNKIEKIKKINKLKNELNNIEFKIKENKKKEYEIDYYYNTCEILYNYYNQHDINILKERYDKDEMSMDNEQIIEHNDLNQYLNKYKINPKKEMFREYINKIEEDIILKDIKHLKEQRYCKYCKEEKTEIQNEGALVCMNCGDTEHIIIECDKPSYKEPPPDMMFYYYKRLNHFTEWLNNFQAKETTNIPSEIYDKILNEFKKQRIYDVKKLNYSQLRKILKKLKLNRYYEHIHHIMNKLNGKKPIVLSRELEEKLRLMFKEIQEPFQEVCPKNRKNFLSYSYVIRKFLELLGQDKISEYFPTLKSREKLYQQDLIWKGICNILNWDYIPSI